MYEELPGDMLQNAYSLHLNHGFEILKLLIYIISCKSSHIHFIIVNNETWQCFGGDGLAFDYVLGGSRFCIYIIKGLTSRGCRMQESLESL